MRRIIVLPADGGEAGLAELKQWLGISRNNEDALLSGLIAAALELCEAFTGQAPLQQTIEEHLPLRSGVQPLSARPVHEIIGADVVAQDGARTPLGALAYAADITACGAASFRLIQPLEGRTVAVRLVTGIAPDWGSLPPALRQGILRLAAHYYRDRDSDGQRSPAPPPLSVTALWRPWRLMRLA